MDQASLDLDLEESLGTLPRDFGEPSPSCLSNLAVKSGISLDAEPFINSLRKVYQNQFSTTVAIAVLKYRDQICELDTAFPPAVTALQGSVSLLVDDKFL